MKNKYGYEPPESFFKYSETSKVINLNVVKARLVNYEKLGITFLMLSIPYCCNATELTRRLNSVFENSYLQQTYRLLKELVNLGVVKFKRYSDISPLSDSEIDKMILDKHKKFLDTAFNPFNNKFDNMTYYYLVDEIASEIFDFVASKYNWVKHDGEK